MHEQAGSSTASQSVATQKVALEPNCTSRYHDSHEHMTVTSTRQSRAHDSCDLMLHVPFYVGLASPNPAHFPVRPRRPPSGPCNALLLLTGRHASAKPTHKPGQQAGRGGGQLRPVAGPSGVERREKLPGSCPRQPGGQGGAQGRG